MFKVEGGKAVKKLLFGWLMISIILIPQIYFAWNPPSDVTPSVPVALQDRAEIILGTIQVVGAAIAVGMLIYIGMKYVMSSANERADVKQAAVNYVIGAIIIASAPMLFRLIYEFFIKAKLGG